MVRALVVLVLTLVAFLFHSVLGLEAATIALLGATVLMLVGPLDPHEALRDIEWSTLFFFVGLFMLIEAVVHVGIVSGVADTLADAAGGNLTIATMGILWFSALASAIVDNIPYTATAIPIVQQLAETGLDAEPMWWALALGACLGGNLTIVGASANIVVANLAARDGGVFNLETLVNACNGAPVYKAALLNMVNNDEIRITTQTVNNNELVQVWKRTAINN